MERCKAVPYEGERPYFFVSYSHGDLAQVFPILERLEVEGYRLWYDEGIDPGSEWPETIAAHLTNASACVGMISNNYLQSDNCRRELNYALKKHIPFLPVFLEDAEMSAGVEMQLSANRSIFKYRLPTEDAFYQTLSTTKCLQPCREQPVAKAEPEPAPAPEPKPAPPAKPEKQAAPKPAKPGKKPRKIVPIVIAVLLAALVLLGIVIGLSAKTSGKGSSAAPAASRAPTEADLLFTDTARAQRVLYGKRTPTDFPDAESFLQRMQFMDVSLDGSVTNISALPYTIEGRRDEHPEIIRLSFLDKTGAEYTVQGLYAVTDGKLTVSHADAVFDDARGLDGELSYSISLSNKNIRLRSDEFGKSLYYGSSEEILCGAAEAETFRDISAFDIRQIEEGAACTLRFTDGGRTLDAQISALWKNIGSLQLQWTHEQRLYNGSMAEFDASGKCSFYYVNTYPYGFLLIDNGTVYSYQEPFPAD